MRPKSEQRSGTLSSLRHNHCRSSRLHNHHPYRSRGCKSFGSGDHVYSHFGHLYFLDFRILILRVLAPLWIQALQP